ncbi:MAG: retropepsin-like aspartic protease [Bdellovibrionia bacterium]
MRSQLYPFKVLAAVQCIWISALLLALGACKGSEQEATPTIQSAREDLPSPIDPAALSEFKDAFEKDESHSVRFHLLSRNFYMRQRIGQIFIGCNLDGKNERICLLDTGTAASSVPEDPFTLTYDSAGKVYWYLKGAVTQVGHSIDLKMFLAAGAAFSNTRLMRLFPTYFPVNLASQGIDGVIGEDLLLESGLTLDFKNSRVEIGRIGDRDKLPNSFRLNLNQQVVMPVELNGDAVEAVFDTGASFTAVNRKWIQAHSDQFEELEDAAERTFSGEINKTHVYRARMLKVGEVEFSSLYVIALDFARMPWLDSKTVVILGYNVISKGNWKLDYPSLHWSFNAPSLRL